VSIRLPTRIRPWWAPASETRFSTAKSTPRNASRTRDPKWGEIVTAYVVTREGIPIPIDELDAMCRDTLAAYKRPRKYVALDELPKNAADKFLKRLLKVAGERE
jgi:acyl-CoA synthetase (AMP-forming)/AMP-acid ligase II